MWPDRVFVQVRPEEHIVLAWRTVETVRVLTDRYNPRCGAADRLDRRMMEGVDFGTGSAGALTTMYFRRAATAG